jgi:cytoskeleton protein RodZ
MASSGEPHGDPNPSAPRVGAELQAARFRIGWALEEIAARLRIRLAYLAAIEEGQIGDLPGAAYAVGFVRTYASALGLDPDEVARRFRAEADEVNYQTELDFPVPMAERGVPAGAVILVGVVLAVAAYAGWYRLSGEGTLPPEVVPPVPERLAPLAQQIEPPSIVAPAPAPPASPVPAPTTTAVVVPTDTEPPPVSVPPSQAAAMPFRDVGRATSGAESAGVLAQPANPDDSRILLRAKSDSWVLVREPKGAVLYNHIMHPGDTWPVPPKPGLLLTTGNAAGTEVVVDGATTPPLGGPGVVRREVPLDPEALKSGRSPVQQTATGASPATSAKPAAAPGQQ